ncbi:TRAP transporter small permease subunit [Chloroflexota bacterium]
MTKVRAFCRAVDTINEWAGGKFISILAIGVVGVTAAEVVLRYIFNQPTIWATDLNLQLMAAIITVGAGYTLLQKQHVIVDVVVTRFSPRVRAILDLATSSFFFLGIGVMFWRSVIAARESIMMRELMSTIWEPPLYPIRVVMAIGLFLFLLQGTVKFIRDLNIAFTGKEDLL